MRLSHRDSRYRFVFLSVFIYFLFALLIFHYYRIQVKEHEKWSQIAKSQHQTVVIEPFHRGHFYSNTQLKEGHLEKKQPFVVDVLLYHLFIDPTLIPEELKEQMASEIGQKIECSDLESHLQKKTRSRRIAMWLDLDKKKEIETWWNAFARSHKIPRNALYFGKDYKRSYPFGKMLSQVLHTVREEKDVKTHQAIPTGGLEYTFDHYLRGIEGKKIILRSPRYELENDEVAIKPTDGADVYLTINHVLQAIVEEELANGVKKVGGKGGWAVMMNPYTGEIWALAHYPFFDPENYREYFNDEEKLEWTKNKVITHSFEPGSTMKAISVAIGMKANEELIKQGKKPIFSPHEMFRTDDQMFPGRSLPLKDVRDHNYLNMYMAIQKSSNIYVARLIQKVVEHLGVEWYRNQLVEVFGLGKKTGIELPYENPGMIPTPGKTYLSGAYEWSLATPYSLAMGYNLSVNAIQMARAYSVFANGGYLVTPTLLRKIVSKDTIIIDNTKNREGKRVLSDQIVKEVVKAMKYATKPGGSSYLADIPGFTQAGKSGTSEKNIKGKYEKSRHFSTFIGFAPASRPEFVLFVGIDEPEKFYIPGFGMTHFGGKCSAPVFREISRRTLQYLGIAPDDPYGYPKNDPRSSPEKADFYKELQELAKLYEKWNK